MCIVASRTPLNQITHHSYNKHLRSPFFPSLQSCSKTSPQLQKWRYKSRASLTWGYLWRANCILVQRLCSEFCHLHNISKNKLVNQVLHGSPLLFSACSSFLNRASESWCVFLLTHSASLGMWSARPAMPDLKVGVLVNGHVLLETVPSSCFCQVCFFFWNRGLLLSIANERKYKQFQRHCQEERKR